MEVFYNTEKYTLSYSKEDKLASIEWKNKCNSEEYRELFMKLDELNGKNRVLYLLSDTRNEGLVSTEDIQWLISKVVEKNFVEPIKVALVIDESLYSNIYAETIKRKLKASPIQINIFKDIVSAKAWLV